MFDMFSENLEAYAPLADRLRPKNLKEFRGQKHIIGKGRLLRRAIEADRLSSIILYGPPGTGKTSLAYVISQVTSSAFVRLNAVSTGVKEVRQVIDQASEQLKLYGKKTILFLDEIHRFNKAQQDALLPSVEKGEIILIGATTENPFFEVNAALLSRSQIFRLEPMSKEEIKDAIAWALQDEERGLGKMDIQIDPEAVNHIIDTANGDLRKVYNAIELAVTTTEPDRNGTIHITLDIAEDSIQQPAMRYDTGDQRYVMMSAMIKSIRGSDTDAALYWMARMLEAGEDPKYIIRRMIVHASEDIGMANPSALEQAVAAWHAVQAVGLPEARINMAQCIIYLSESPKSNAVVKAIDAALEDIRNGKLGKVPLHLRDTHYKGAEQFGHGKGYQYPHDYPNHYVKQEYLPKELLGTQYYKPSDQGMEAKIQQRKNRQVEK